MEKYKKNKKKFDEVKALKEEQMNSQDLNLFGNDTKSDEISPPADPNKEEENPQLENMPKDDSLNLGENPETLPDTLVEVDIDGDIYEAKMNKGDDTVTLTKKDRDKSAGDKLNMENPAEDLNSNNQNINNMENQNMTNLEKRVKDPFKNRKIIFEDTSEEDDDIFPKDDTEKLDNDSEPAALEEPGTEEPTEAIEEPKSDVTEDSLEPIAEEPIADENPTDNLDINLDSEELQSTAEKIGEVIEDAIEDKVAELVPNADTEQIDDFDDFDDDWDDFDDDDFDDADLGEEDLGSEDVVPEPEESREVITDADATDQEEPGLNNISKEFQEKVKRIEKQNSTLLAENKILKQNNVKMNGTLKEIQLFTEKVSAMSEIDKIGTITEQDKNRLKDLIQGCTNSVEIKTVLHTFKTLKEGMSKKFNNVKDILKEHNISPQLRNIVETINSQNPEIIKEQNEKDRMLELAGLRD